MVVDGAVADELNLWDSRDGLEVRVQDGGFRLASLVVSVTVAVCLGVESLESARSSDTRRSAGTRRVETDLCERVLGLWRQVAIAKEQETVLDTGVRTTSARDDLEASITL